MMHLLESDIERTMIAETNCPSCGMQRRSGVVVPAGRLVCSDPGCCPFGLGLDARRDKDRVLLRLGYWRPVGAVVEGDHRDPHNIDALAVDALAGHRLGAP